MPAPTAAGQLLRARCVGGSELLAILVRYPDLFPDLEGARHPYTSASQVFLRIARGVDYRVETGAMRLGDRLEPAIAREASRHLGLNIRRAWRTYQHPATRLASSPDYIVLNAPELLEVKLSGDYGLWADLPPHVEWQARAQLATTDRQRVHVAALVGTSLRTFIVERDADTESRMLAAVDCFFADHVDPGSPPDEPDAPGELVLTMRLPAGTVPAAGAIEDVGDLLADVSARRKREEAAEGELRDSLMHAMAEADARLVIGRSWRAEVTTTARGIASLRFTNGAAPMA